MQRDNNIPKGYKLSPFGPIPNNWEIKELNEVVDFLDGKRKPIKDADRAKMRGIYPYYGASGIIDYVNDYIFDEELILLGEDGANIINRSTPLAFRVSGKIWVNNHAHVLKPKKDTSLGFLTEFLESIKYDKYNTGTAQPKLNKEVCSAIPVIQPPLKEQTAIANLLSTWDKAINTLTQLIAQKELRKKWLMQQLLTGKKRLKGFKGNWGKERLGNYLIKHDEKTTKNNQYPILTSSRKGIFLQSDYYTRDVASEDNTGYNVVPRGYFTYRHMSDDLIFKFNINTLVDKGIVSTLYPVFTTKNINEHFLLVKLNEGNEFKIHAGEQKQGGSRTYIYFSALSELKVTLPSIEEQTAISNVLKVFDAELNLLRQKLDKLKEQKKGLMQVLLTGKKRLKF